MLMIRVALGCGAFAAMNPSPSAGCMTNHGATRSAIANNLHKVAEIVFSEAEKRPSRFDKPPDHPANERYWWDGWNEPTERMYG